MISSGYHELQAPEKPSPRIMIMAPPAGRGRWRYVRPVSIVFSLQNWDITVAPEDRSTKKPTRRLIHVVAAGPPTAAVSLFSNKLPTITTAAEYRQYCASCWKKCRKEWEKSRSCFPDNPFRLPNLICCLFFINLPPAFSV